MKVPDHESPEDGRKAEKVGGADDVRIEPGENGRTPRDHRHDDRAKLKVAAVSPGRHDHRHFLLLDGNRWPVSLISFGARQLYINLFHSSVLFFTETCASDS